MNNPILSIIIPVYNAEKHIKHCIDKVLRINLNKEIIVVNDGSTDKSLEILNEYSNKIVLIDSKTNNGLSSSRNLGIAKSSGSYISFVDIDDDFDLEMHSKMLSKIIESESDICICNFDYVTPEGIALKSKCSMSFENLNHEQIIEYFLFNKIVTGVWAAVFKTKIVKEILFNKDIRMGEDILFMLQYLLRASKTSFVDECLYHYTQNDLSMMHTLSNRLTEYSNIPDALNANEIDILLSTFSDGFEYFKLEMIKRSVHAISLVAKQNKNIAILLLKKCCTKSDCSKIIKNKYVPKYLKIEFLIIKFLGYKVHLFVFPLYNIVRKLIRQK